MDYKARYESYRAQVERQLEMFLPADEVSPALIKEAMRYSLMAGGKRVRPVLGLAAADLIRKGASEERAVQAYTSAVEMIHTYSLIHDDLPAMDNDTLRRGKPTNHVVFGEAMAILAGDALLTRAFELMGEAGEPDAGLVRAWAGLARRAGSAGMIGGQVMDIKAEGRTLEADELKLLQSLKTGALFRTPIEGVLEILDADAVCREALPAFALHLGRAFQIRDDILDAVASTEDMGKTVGKDAENDKATYVTLFGMAEAEASLAEANREAAGALDRLSRAGYDCGFLNYILETMSGRKS